MLATKIYCEAFTKYAHIVEIYGNMENSRDY